MPDQICGNCRFWVSDDTKTQCRRMPPYLFVLPATTFQPAVVLPIWPTPGKTEFCGEWRGLETGRVVQFPQRDPGDENPSGAA